MNTEKKLLMKDSTFYLIAEILKRYKNNKNDITNTLEWFIDEFSYKLEGNLKFNEKYFRNYIYEKSIEICQNCGKSVARGSGLFVNRVVDFDDYKCRVEKGCPFPEGDFICQECEEKLTVDRYEEDEPCNMDEYDEYERQQELEDLEEYNEMKITRKELDIQIEALKKFFADLDIRLKKLEKKRG